MLRALLIAATLLVALPASSQQSETLADIRQDLAVLAVELRGLRAEMNTTGGPAVIGGGTALDRINAIESALQQITAKTEQLEFRLGRVVEDGTNRLGDLQFRLCELEPGCDLATVGRTDPLGGEVASITKPALPAAEPGTDALPFDGELAVSEEADFRAAQEALESGDLKGAELLFSQFRDTYPMGPLEPAALLGEGRALEAQGDTREAARRYLSAYSGFPDASTAPEALWRLGDALAAIGSVNEACITLGEVGRRYPGAAVIANAESSRSKLGCQ
jgi:tol-pal system protein YbgF